MPAPQFESEEAEIAYRKAERRIAEAAREKEVVLDLSGLGLTSVPPEVGQLASLTELYLYNNQLTSLPPEIGQLASLTSLNLSGNQLTSVPPEIGQLASLTWLNLHDNQLTSLPPEIGQLASLTTLYLYNNQLTSVPPEIGQLASLTTLFLYNNQLTSVPPEIGLLGKLTTLSVNNNQLTSLPPEIGQLASVITLFLDNNQLTSLPPEIGQLVSLTRLGLTRNQLTALPLSLQNLTKLGQLMLHGNRGLRLSPSVLGTDWNLNDEGYASLRSILDFYFSRESSTERPLNEAKLILVGRGGAGKTCTVRAIRGEKFRDDEDSTPGIALCDWVMEGCRKGPVTAHVWDFAGQVVTHSLHQFFFSVRSVYVLVLSGRENNERDDAEYWLRLIKAFGTDEEGNGPPVIVTLNKWDLAGCRPKVDRGALRERYPFIRAFVELDCKTGRGVEKLKKTLARETDRLNWVREPFAAHWGTIRKKLSTSGKRQPFLTYADFREFCSKHGEPDPGRQDSLAEILHRLGSAINYRNDPRLREATVLQPEWLTKNDGVAKRG